ncbi:MAG: 4-oxalocrotonate tautomerase DmpI [Candidatus Omnitrophota bacterium]
MPNVTLEGPRIENLDTKRELVKTVTDAAVKAFGLPEKTIVVVIKENPPENVGVGGQLVIDMTK